MAFTCPRCGRVSHSRGDEREGYCGACRDWTAAVPGEVTARRYQCESCGLGRAVLPSHAGRVWCPCGSARAMAPAPWVTASAVEFGAAAWPGDGEVLAAGAARGLWHHTSPANLSHSSSSAGDGPAEVNLAAAARYIAVVYGLPPLVTGSQRNPGTDSGRLPVPGPGRQPEVDDAPWGDSMEWSPGDAEL